MLQSPASGLWSRRSGRAAPVLLGLGSSQLVFIRQPVNSPSTYQGQGTCERAGKKKEERSHIIFLPPPTSSLIRSCPQSPKPTLLPSSPPRTRSQRRFRGGGFRPPPAPSRGCFTLNRRVLRSPHRALDFPRPRPHPRRRSPKEPESAPHRPAHSLSPSPRPVCRLALPRLRLPHRRPGPLGQFWVWLHRYNASSTFGQHTPTKSINPPWLDDAQPVRIQNHRHPPLEMLAVVFSLA